MPDIKRPRRGSMAYYPRKRARRIYPQIKAVSSEAKPLGFAGYKAGMTHVVLSGKKLLAKAVTVIECPVLTVFGFRCYANGEQGLVTYADSFAKPAKNLERKVKIKEKKPEIDVSKVSCVRLLCSTNPLFKKKPDVFEVPLGGDVSGQIKMAEELFGKEIKITDIFKPGDYIDVSAVTKGKGFQGPVKRFGIKVLDRHHKQMQRHVGSLGPENVARIRHTVPSAGQLGFQTRTELNKRILKISETPDLEIKHVRKIKSSYIFIEGSVPGPKKRLILMRPAVRNKKAATAEISYVYKG